METSQDLSRLLRPKIRPSLQNRKSKKWLVAGVQ
jgi:hypothetical protein